MNRSRAEKNSVSEDPRTEIAAADAINIDEDNEIQSPKMSLTTRRSASLAAHGEVKRGHINAALKVRLHCGGEAPAPGPEFFTVGESSKMQETPAAGSCNMHTGSDELGSSTEPVSGLVHEGKNMQPRIESPRGDSYNRHHDWR